MAHSYRSPFLRRHWTLGGPAARRGRYICIFDVSTLFFSVVNLVTASCTHNCTILSFKNHQSLIYSTAKMSFILFISFLFAIASPAAAQTWTSCNPLNQTNCPTDPALGISNATFDLTKSQFANNVWNTTAGNILYGDNGAEFTIAKEGDSPTIQSKFYILFGEVEVWLQAAPGQGVVSSTYHTPFHPLRYGSQKMILKLYDHSRRTPIRRPRRNRP